jgi:uncharacterized membrane protein
MKVSKHLGTYWNSFSFVGLAVATLFFAASVTPSLLPRTYYVQGILSGLAIAVGYSLGVSGVLLYRFLEFRLPSARIERVAKRVTSVFVAAIVVLFLWQMTDWQNSVRQRMEMPSAETGYPYRMGLIALASGACWIACWRLFVRCCLRVSEVLHRILPRRVAIALGCLLVITGILLVGNGVVIRGALALADDFFRRSDAFVDDNVPMPTDDAITGSPSSLIQWEAIGLRGKEFILGGPTEASISEFSRRAAKRPIRVYAGMNSGQSPRERASLALKELIRVGGFERSVLVIATPTGTGWLDPGAVDTVEYLHAGDTAIISTQYSYLPSWMTIVVDPRRSIESANALFDTVYAHWKNLPKDRRPKLYLFGLSLGALGSEDSTDLVATFEDPIQGAVWSGPPFPSRHWQSITADRNVGTPSWLPTYRDGRIVRFTAQRNAIDPQQAWGPIRTVYLQYASDPMVFFSTSMAFRRPSWLSDPRGPDVSPDLQWFPIVTFLQVGFDLPMATSVPIGYGHNYAPQHYIDAWVAVTQPSPWTQADTDRLKAMFGAAP